MKENTFLTTQELSKYLKLNEKTVLKMAQTKELPGVKIGSQWRFHLQTVDEYLQDKIVRSSNYGIDTIIRSTDILPLSRLIETSNIDLELKAESRDEVLRELSELAVASGVAVSAGKLFDALLKRENMLSTAIEKGIAVPHPRNPSDELFRRPAIIVGRSINGVDFLSPDGSKTRLFFMPCAPDVILHLKFLSNIARLFEDPGISRAFMKVVSKEEFIKILLSLEKEEIFKGKAADQNEA
ncbi:MAG: PTS sugar transporter subunit IIA [Candidatus Omnitrophota bacterium]